MNLNDKIDQIKDELISGTQKILRIRSIEDRGSDGMPFGEGIGEALEKTLEMGRKLGFEVKNLDGYMGYIEWGSGEEYVGVLGHLDVVPEGDGWIYPPYGAEVHDGKIYARGSLDDKGPVIASLFGMYALKEIGYKPGKKIRILLGTNEETGSRDVQYYLNHEQPPITGFTPDANFPVIFAEKGLTVFNIIKKFNTSDTSRLVYIKGGQRHNMVPDYCEALLNVENREGLFNSLEQYTKLKNYRFEYEETEKGVIIKSYGISAHGSTPELGKNAVMQLIGFLNYSNICTGSEGETIRFLDEKIGMEYNGTNFGIYLKDEDSGELTFNVGTINLDSEGLRIGLNIRYPVTYTLDSWFEKFKEKAEETDFEIEEFEHQLPLYFPKDHKLIKILSKVYEEQTGDKSELIAIGGGTYAKEMPNIVAFGPIFPGKPDLDHQANEYIEIEDLVKMCKIYANAIKELSSN